MHVYVNVEFFDWDRHFIFYTKSSSIMPQLTIYIMYVNWFCVSVYFPNISLIGIAVLELSWVSQHTSM